MYHYALVLGAKREHAKQLNHVMKQLHNHYLVKKKSRAICGPSETQEPDARYINISIVVESGLIRSELKKDLLQFEMFCNLIKKKMIDIDIVIQKKNNEIIFISKKLAMFCHCLITIQDIWPDLFVPDIKLTLYDAMINHPTYPNFYYM